MFCGVQYFKKPVFLQNAIVDKYLADFHKIFKKHIKWDSIDAQERFLKNVKRTPKKML